MLFAGWELKRLTSCGYLHLVTDSGSLQSLCSYSRLLITIHYYFRCLLRRTRTDPGPDPFLFYDR